MFRINGDGTGRRDLGKWPENIGLWMELASPAGSRVKQHWTEDGGGRSSLRSRKSSCAISDIEVVQQLLLGQGELAHWRRGRSLLRESRTVGSQCVVGCAISDISSGS